MKDSMTLNPGDMLQNTQIQMINKLFIMQHMYIVQVVEITFKISYKHKHSLLNITTTLKT